MVGELAVTLFRPGETRLHGTASFKNVGRQPISTSVNDLFYVIVDGEPVWPVRPENYHPSFGTGTIAPGESRSASFDVTITAEDRRVSLRATSWSARIGSGNPKGGSVELSAAISDIPLAQ